MKRMNGPVVTFPHMGTLHVALKGIMESLGLSCVVPPPVGPEALRLGARHAPEAACLPLKIGLGNLMQAYEMGADTVIMGGGVGPCRFGYYARVQQEILQDLGYNYNWVVLEPPRGHISELWDKLSALTGRSSLLTLGRALWSGWTKLRALDRLDRVVSRVRPREPRRGLTGNIWTQAVRAIDRAENTRQVRVAEERFRRKLESVAKDDPETPQLRVGVVGEIYMVCEPAANLGVEESLGNMGLEVVKKLYISDWVRDHLILDALRWNRSGEKVREAARPYLEHFVGGEGVESVGNTVLYARQGIEGVVHIMPFTCMPEIVARTVTPGVSRDFDLPILTLVMDEHTAPAGLLTRLEAFVDLLRRRRLAYNGNEFVVGAEGSRPHGLLPGY